VGYWSGSISSMLQDNGGVGVSDPYSDTNNIGSSYSDLATQLIGAAANVGESYAVSQVSGGNVVPTGNPLAPTTVIPTTQQALQAAQVRTIGQASASSGTILEYGVIGVIGLLLVFAVARKKG
jgi:hypothetical protein